MMKNTSITGQEHARLWRAQDLGNLEVLQASYTKHSFARHTHEEFMIGVIEGGGCEFCYRGDTHIALAGSIVLVNPGEAHDGSRHTAHKKAPGTSSRRRNSARE
jgi:AraC-like ligand binding domain